MRPPAPALAFCVAWAHNFHAVSCAEREAVGGDGNVFVVSMEGCMILRAWWAGGSIGRRRHVVGGVVIVDAEGGRGVGNCDCGVGVDLKSFGAESGG